MSPRRRIEITVETQRNVVLRQPLAPELVWCEVCGLPVRMIPPDIAAARAHVTVRTVYRWVEAGRLHFAEPPGGVLRICLSSLEKHLGIGGPVRLNQDTQKEIENEKL